MLKIFNNEIKNRNLCVIIQLLVKKCTKNNVLSRLISQNLNKSLKISKFATYFCVSGMTDSAIG